MELLKINNRIIGKEQRGIESSGFTLIEILIAMAIFSIGILAIATMQLSSVNGNGNARRFSEAAAFAQGQIELIQLNSFNNVPAMPSMVPPGVVNASGYRILTTIQGQSDLDANGTNDVMTILVQVFDPSGVERSRVSFLKSRSVF